MTAKNKFTWKIVFSLLSVFIHILVYLFLGAVLLYYGYSDAARYWNSETDIIHLTAVGHSIREVKDDEGDIDYHLYVIYEYEGKTYTAGYRSYNSKNVAEVMIGQKVEIYVNPTNPVELWNNVLWKAFICCIFGSASLGVSVSDVFHLRRKGETEAHGWCREHIEKDIWKNHLERISKWVGFYAAAVFIIPFAILVPEFLNAVICYILVACAIGTLMLVLWFCEGRKIREGRYTTSRHTLVNKKIDMGEGKDYLLYYSDGKLIWPRSVSEKRYEAAQPGETVETVFLEGAKTPILVYDQKDSIKSAGQEEQ